MQAQAKQSEGAAHTAAKTASRPTPDQMYLASRLVSPDDPPKAGLSPAALQRLNTRWGRTTVTDALRIMRGFPPEIAVRSVYAYCEGICRSGLTVDETLEEAP